MAFITAPTLKIRSVQWTLDRPAQINISAWTGRRTVVANPWHGKWSARIELAPAIGEANIRALRSFLARCKGALNTFRLYATEAPQNSNSGVTIASTAATGATQLSIAGYTTPLLDGQFFTVNGQLLQLTADQSGGLLAFEPPLRQQAASGTTVVTSRPYALVYMTNSSLGWSVNSGQQYGISFDVEEALLEADGVAPEVTAPTLATITGSLSVAENSANGTIVGTPTGYTSGSTKSLSNDAGGRFAINSTTGQITVANGSLLDYETATSHNVTIVETLVGATGSPKSTTLSIGITDVADTSSPAAVFTMTQLPAADRIYQRITTSGGGQGKGQGTIPVTISISVAGALYARIRSSDGTTILQSAFLVGTVSTGSLTINVTGVDARLGWFYVDLSGDASSWTNGTTLVGMGALFGIAGQSLAQRMIGRRDNTNTLATTGVTASAYGRALATYQDGGADYMPTVSTMPWTQFADRTEGSAANSTGGAEFTNRMITMLGVNCGLIGHAHGGQTLSAFVSGGGNADAAQLAAVLARAGGAWEGFIWGQGHTESQANMIAEGYKRSLAVLMSQVAALNSFSGCKYYVWGIPAVGSFGFGSNWAYTQVNKGGSDWCTANGGTYVHMYDFKMADVAHENQIGAITMARHMYRATRANYGQTSGLGPKPLSAVRTSSTNIRVTLSDVGQTNLVLSGAPQTRICVFPTGRSSTKTSVNDNRFPISVVTVVDKVTLDLTLANDPGDQHVLDLYFYYGFGPTDPTVDNIYDNRTDSDGISTGRIVQANFSPITVAAYNASGSAANAPPSGYVAAVSQLTMTQTSTTYATGLTGFGQALTGGSGLTTPGAPNLPDYSIEMIFVCPTLSGTDIKLFQGMALDFLMIGASDYKVHNGLTGVVSSTAFTPGHRYHVCYQQGPSGFDTYITDITAAGSSVRDYHAAPDGNAYWTLFERQYGINANVGTGGSIDMVAVWVGPKYSGSTYTRPTTPYVGTETNLQFLTQCDGNLVDAVGK